MSSGDYKLNSVVVESPSPVQTLPDIMDLKYSRLVPVPHHLLEFAQVLSWEDFIIPKEDSSGGI